jgi:hypothetical protein
MKYCRVYIANKSDAVAYYNLLKHEGAKFKLRHYAKGFAFIFEVA